MKINILLLLYKKIRFVYYRYITYLGGGTVKHILTVAGLLAFSIPYACQGLSPRVITISLLILLFSYIMLLPSLRSLIATLADNPLLTLLMLYIVSFLFVG